MGVLAETIGIADNLLSAGVASGVISFLFWQLMLSQDRYNKSLLGEKDRLLLERDSANETYRKLADEGIASALQTTNYYRQKYEDKPPLIPVAKVVSLGNSPSTRKQREDAEIQTLMATLAMIRLETGLPPRPEPEHAAE